MSSQQPAKPNAFLVSLMRGFTSLFNALPLVLRFGFVAVLLRIVMLIKPKYLRLAEQQIAESFPERDATWHHSLAISSRDSFVRAIVDFFRGPFLSPDWIASHVEILGVPELLAESRRAGKPVMLVGGHVGSFDLLAQLIAASFRPMSFVIRNAKSISVDAWWRGMRESRGNTTLRRSGAIKGMLRALKDGRDVGILFDQNVTADFAVFVPWFGRLAATTKAVAMVALKTECPIAVATLHFIGIFDGHDRYRLEYQLMPVADVYASSDPSDQKAYEITKRASTMLEQQIRKFPEQWFWMHRRWRTRPASEIVASLSNPTNAQN